MTQSPPQPRGPYCLPSIQPVMGDSLDVRLLKRSLGASARDRSVKTLYGHKTWVEDFDIVNELGGHTGCVNALR